MVQVNELYRIQCSVSVPCSCSDSPLPPRSGTVLASEVLSTIVRELLVEAEEVSAVLLVESPGRYRELTVGAVWALSTACALSTPCTQTHKIADIYFSGHVCFELHLIKPNWSYVNEDLKMHTDGISTKLTG